MPSLPKAAWQRLSCRAFSFLLSFEIPPYELICGNKKATAFAVEESLPLFSFVQLLHGNHLLCGFAAPILTSQLVIQMVY